MCVMPPPAATVGRAAPYILHIFRSVSPPYWQWPAPMGSWRVQYCTEVVMFVYGFPIALCVHLITFTTSTPRLSYICRVGISVLADVVHIFITDVSVSVSITIDIYQLIHSKKSQTNQLGFTYSKALRSINLSESSRYLLLEYRTKYMKACWNFK